MRYTEHVAQIVIREMHVADYWETLKETDHQEDQDVRGLIISRLTMYR
jgi:hypothetical protein